MGNADAPYLAAISPTAHCPHQHPFPGHLLQRAPWWAPGSSLVKGTPEILLLFLPGTPNLGFKAFPSLAALWEGAFCGAKIKTSPWTSLGILQKLGRGKGAGPPGIPLPVTTSASLHRPTAPRDAPQQGGFGGALHAGKARG